MTTDPFEDSADLIQFEPAPEVDLAAGVTKLASGVEIPQRITCAGRLLVGRPDSSLDVEFEMVIELLDERYECTELRLRPLTADLPLTTEMLRIVPIQRVLRAAVVKTVTTEGFNVEKPPIRKAGPSDDDLAAVATVYEMFSALSFPPVKAVEKKFGISRATAGRWVAEAKRRGFITDGEVE